MHKQVMQVRNMSALPHASTAAPGSQFKTLAGGELGGGCSSAAVAPPAKKPAKEIKAKIMLSQTH